MSLLILTSLWSSFLLVYQDIITPSRTIQTNIIDVLIIKDSIKANK